MNLYCLEISKYIINFLRQFADQVLSKFFNLFALFELIQTDSFLEILKRIHVVHLLDATLQKNFIN